MVIKRRTHQEGLTLLELTLAVAIFVIVIGVAAQILISFYTTMDVQNQRVVAINHSRSLLNDMRNIRNLNPNTSTNPTNVQTMVLTRYPNGTELTGPTTLRNSKVMISYENASPTANPLIPTIRVQWLDLRGHTCATSVTSALTDR